MRRVQATESGTGTWTWTWGGELAQGTLGPLETGSRVGNRAPAKRALVAWEQR